jgi:formylglycine-generating enzyme required for sulfatase activity
VYWASQTAFAALNTAIEAAETTASNPAADQAEVDTAESALTVATTTFSEAKQPGTRAVSGPGIDKTALTAALAAANAAKSDVVVSAEGSNIAKNVYWASQTAFAALNTAIEAAETMSSNPAADQAEVDTAESALTAATTTFKAAKQPGARPEAPPEADKTALNAALEVAYAAKTGVAVSAGGSEVAQDAYWTTGAEFTAFTDAIAAVETAASNPAATQAEIDTAASALTAAIGVFTAVKKPGTRPPPVVADKTALNAALEAAYAAKTGIAVSVDGSDVLPEASWASQAAFAALNEAINAAETVARSPAAAQAEIDAVRTALTEAIGVFTAAKQPGSRPPPAAADKGALNAALEAVYAAKTGVAVSAGGGDVATDTFWVTQAVLDAFDTAIAAAETTTQNIAATQAGVDSAESALTTATSVFNKAKRKGTKPVTLKTVSLPGGLGFNLRYVGPPGPGGFKWKEGLTDIATIRRGYWIGETEVTQELFQAVMKTNPSSFAGAAAPSGETKEKRPVENVNWYAAITFCNKLSILDGRTPVYSVKIGGAEVDWANIAYSNIPLPSTGVVSGWDAAIQRLNTDGYRLPFEMEWMWAAIGGNEGGPTVTSVGYAKPFAGSNGANSIGDYAWHALNAGGKTHEVGKKLPNELGLYDMSGNVAEWCWDMEGQTEFSVARHAKPDDPARMFRGGGWVSVPAACAVGHREETHDHPSRRINYLGFRVVLDQ